MFNTALLCGSVAPFVNTPTFVLNSKYDLWQSKQIIGAGDCGSNISACPAPLQKFWVDYGNEMLTLVSISTRILG